MMFKYIKGSEEDFNGAPDWATLKTSRSDEYNRFFVEKHCNGGRLYSINEKREIDPISNIDGYIILAEREPVKDFDECVASGESCSYVPDGPRGEMQCRYCGKQKVIGPITELQQRIHAQNRAAGWWDNPREKGTLLCLIHSEISEAMEGERKDLMDDHLPHRKMAEVELADAVIRILDYAEAFGYDIEAAINEKLDYNRVRKDHKRETRAGKGGKQF